MLDNKEQSVKASDTVIIPMEHFHSIRVLTKFNFIEVQSGNSLVEEDIERTERKWSE